MLWFDSSCCVKTFVLVHFDGMFKTIGVLTYNAYMTFCVFIAGQIGIFSNKRAQGCSQSFRSFKAGKETG